MPRYKKPSGDFIKLPESELQIMQIIWDMSASGAEEISAGAMLERYPALIGRLKLTTVLTLITRLASRGYIEIFKRGRANCYRPLIDEDAYKSGAAADFVATVYKNNSRGLLSALWNNGILSEKDVDELRRMIGGGGGSGNGNGLRDSDKSGNGTEAGNGLGDNGKGNCDKGDNGIGNDKGDNDKGDNDKGDNDKGDNDKGDNDKGDNGRGDNNEGDGGNETGNGSGL